MTNEFTFSLGDRTIKIEPLKGERATPGEARPVSRSVPGAGEIEIGAIEEFSRDPEARYRVRVNGRNIAQVRAQAWLKEGDHLAGPLRTEFLQASKEREVKGIKHPRWGAQNDIEFTVPPKATFVTCADASTLACIQAESYAAEPGTQVWSTEGVYQRGGGEPFRVKLEFNDSGELIRKIGYYPASGRGPVAPFDLILEEGDTFEPFIYILDSDGKLFSASASPIVIKEGSALRLVDMNLRIEEISVGIVVEDFDGQFFSKNA